MQVPKTEQVYRVIREHGKEWVFSAYDLKDQFSRKEIDLALSMLVKKGDIIRVIRGIYYRPVYNSILNHYSTPDAYQIAKALARKFGWNIYPEGNTVSNYFRLSTQVVVKNIYVSNGPSKTYTIGRTSIIFQHIPTKEVIKNSEHATIVIQAIKAQGKVHSTGWFITRLSSVYPAKEWEKIAKESSGTTGWIYKVIKQARDVAINRECDLSEKNKQGIEDGLKSMEENRGMPLDKAFKKLRNE